MVETQKLILKKARLNTILGPMIAIASDTALYLLEFADQPNLESQIQRLQKKTQSAIISANATPITSIEKELSAYFEGKLKEFKTPLFLLGSSFQNQVWSELRKIPLGETRSYLDMAKAIGKPTAYRALANANGANQLAIVIPCHRVINANGGLGGYAGGLTRKQRLIELEKTEKKAARC